ncbi:MAG: transposase [Stellaceae bacterium]
MRHGLAEMIRYRALLIAAGYSDGNDCGALRSGLQDGGRAAAGERGRSVFATDYQPAGEPRLSPGQALPGPVALKRMMAAMVDLFCDSFDPVPRRILRDIDDTEDRVHGGQQRALFNAHYDSRCS